MKNIVKIIVTLTFITSSFAQAATVDSDSSVSFVFDFSAFGTIDLHQFNYIGDISSPDNPNIALEPNGSFRLDFGTSLRDDSVASHVFTNTFGIPITSVGSVIAGLVIVPSEVSFFYVSVNYVDDVFDIGNFDLIFLDINSQLIYLRGQMITPVPLPAPIVFLASGLVFLRLFTRTKSARN